VTRLVEPLQNLFDSDSDDNIGASDNNSTNDTSDVLGNVVRPPTNQISYVFYTSLYEGELGGLMTVQRMNFYLHELELLRVTNHANCMYKS